MPVEEMEKEKSALSVEELFRSAVKKIDQNVQEQKEFEMKLHALLKGDKRLASAPLTVCTTTYALAICGADENMPLTITKKVIDKAMRPEIRDATGRLTGKTGHDLTEEQIANALNELKNPTMIFKGSQEDSLLAITEIEDNKGRNIVVAIDLDKKENFRVVNSIRSSYGRDNLSNYLVLNIENDNLLAVNTKKADKMLRSIGKSYPKENTFISFDNSIAYTTAYVKYPDKNTLEKEKSFEIDLKVGDNIQYAGEKYTVTSLESDMPNSIQITQKGVDGLDYTSHIDKDKLLSDSSFVYLQSQHEEKTYVKLMADKTALDDYEKGKPFPATREFSGLKNYHVLSELNNTVIGIRSTDYTYATWDGNAVTGVSNGHYMMDREQAFEDFAIRASLIDTDRYLTDEQVKEYNSFLSDTTDNSAFDNEKLEELMSSLELEDDCITFSVITTDDGDKIITGEFVDNFSILDNDDFCSYLDENDIIDNMADISVEFYILGKLDCESHNADDKQIKIIRDNLDFITSYSDLLQSNDYIIDLSEYRECPDDQSCGRR